MEAGRLLLTMRTEVARRLEQIQHAPDVISRYDRDGDGVLDAEELDVLRFVIEAEVARELEDLPTTESPEAAAPRPGPRSNWSLAREASGPALEGPSREVIDERYIVLRELGRGTQGHTYLAQRREDGRFVAVKELRFSSVDSWKSLELFEREAAVLRMLDHPAIPGFIDSFVVENDDSDRRLFLVQEFAAGDSLDVLIAQGQRLTEGQVVAFARQMLDVLRYLHSLNPPVIHRDLKPSNIVSTPVGYSLVDFGAVQMQRADGEAGSTIVGTSGYMPAEQLTGRAVPASDLYALGATMVHLLTHVHPSKLPQKRMALQWRRNQTVSEPLAVFVDRLIAPALEDRFKSATSALAALNDLGQLTMQAETGLVERPFGADARLHHSKEGVVVDMGRSGLAPRLVLSTIGFVVGVVFAVLSGNWAALAMGALVGLAGAELWPTGPSQQLLVKPGGRFKFVHEDRRMRKETSGIIERLALGGDGLHIQTDAGTYVAIGGHCTPTTRRWIFGALDAYLKENPS